MARRAGVSYGGEGVVSNVLAAVCEFLDVDTKFERFRIVDPSLNAWRVVFTPEESNVYRSECLVKSSIVWNRMIVLFDEAI